MATRSYYERALAFYESACVAVLKAKRRDYEQRMVDSPCSAFLGIWAWNVEEINKELCRRSRSNPRPEESDVCGLIWGMRDSNR